MPARGSEAKESKDPKEARDASRAPGLDPKEALEALAASRAPLLVGVRHHSPALAAAMPSILEAFAPTSLLVELPSDLGGWLPWLGHAELEAPVALAAESAAGALFFYPFADFSPELAAIRWAVRHGVTVRAIDRAVLGGESESESEGESGSEGESESESEGEGEGEKGSGRGVLAGMEGGDDVEELWDTLVEARAQAGAHEALRRAALLFGWLLRADSLALGKIPARDREREACMRRHVEQALARGERVAAVIGSFHASALLAKPLLEASAETRASRAPAGRAPEATAVPGGSLIRYDFELLDSRSGYPAGIRDPALMQRIFELHASGRGLEHAVADLLVAIARRVRERGHVASFSDVREASRLAFELATLRGLPGPGRRELLEAIETAMAQGERLGRGRVLAGAMQEILVGARRGRLPDEAPRSGLVPHVEALLAELRFPGPDAEPRSDAATRRRGTEGIDVTLDPLRSPLDRRRAVTLARLAVCGVPYAEALGGETSGARADLTRLTQRARLRFTPETAARLELAGIYGVTLEHAAAGALGRRRRKSIEAESELAEHWVSHFVEACEAALPPLVVAMLGAMPEELLATATLPQLARAIALVSRLDKGGFAGLPREGEGEEAFTTSLAEPLSELGRAAFRILEGMLGSASDDDARALAELLTFDEDGAAASLELGLAVDRLAREGSPLMQGAGLAGRLLLGREEAGPFASTFASFVDTGGEDASSARARGDRIRGALLVAGPMLEGHPSFALSILEALDRMDDARFLARLPSLRHGFMALSPAGRGRLLEALGESQGLLELEVSPAELGAFAEAEEASKAALAALGFAPPEPRAVAPVASSAVSPRPVREGAALSLRDRVRLVLGRQREELQGQAARVARALDELYGHGEGEGSRDEGAGQGSAFPTAREWSGELEALFGTRVRDEILGVAAERGRGAAALELDAEHVHPSIELLEQVLSLKGGLGERELSRLRILVRRITDELVRQLATRLQPALAGLSTPRPTRRGPGPLDLRRTVRDNLDTARVVPGGHSLTPRRFSFRTRARRSLDWRLVLVVDVSGSMEPSVLYSAMMATILAALPAVTVHFVAFNDRVLDLSDKVSDPLELLLGVKIGGGTMIGRALRYARGLLTVPSRSLVVVVSDFEDGGPRSELLAEVRALIESGATALGLAALDDQAAPRFHRGIAAQVASAGMPVAALTPLELASWVGAQMRRGAR